MAPSLPTAEIRLPSESSTTSRIFEDSVLPHMHARDQLEAVLISERQALHDRGVSGVKGSHDLKMR